MPHVFRLVSIQLDFAPRPLISHKDKAPVMAFASGSGSLGDIGGIDALEASDVPPFQVQQLVPLVFLENDKVPDSGLSKLFS